MKTKTIANNIAAGSSSARASATAPVALHRSASVRHTSDDVLDHLQVFDLVVLAYLSILRDLSGIVNVTSQMLCCRVSIRTLPKS